MLIAPGLPSTMLLQYALPPEKLRSRIMALIFVQFIQSKPVAGWKRNTKLKAARAAFNVKRESFAGQY